MSGLRLRLAAAGCLLLHPTLSAEGEAQVAAPGSLVPGVSGYVRSLTGYQDLGYDPLNADRRTSFNAEVVRLKWLWEVPGRLRISAHNRLQARFTSSTTQAGGRNVLGFGVSAVPQRFVDLETTLVDEQHARVWHDVDRLAVTLFLDAADLTVGRQAVTWGISNIFPVADLWTQFAPFELDTEEKPGLDGIRALMYPVPGVEVDAVLADRGAARDVSAGVRTTVELPFADVYGAVGKFWREAIVFAGAAVVLDVWKLRGELAIPWDLDTEAARPVRATLGVDWIATGLQLSFEYHHNGLGANRAADYSSRLAAPEFARGESYYIGRRYLGAVAAFPATDRLSIALTGLANLGDPSLAVTPGFTYDMGQAARISLGALTSFGAPPRFSLTALPDFESEFGLYGDFAYTQISVYF